jgi:hypothetical protein
MLFEMFCEAIVETAGLLWTHRWFRILFFIVLFYFIGTILLDAGIPVLHRPQ